MADIFCEQSQSTSVPDLLAYLPIVPHAVCSPQGPSEEPGPSLYPTNTELRPNIPIQHLLVYW